MRPAGFRQRALKTTGRIQGTARARGIIAPLAAVVFGAVAAGLAAASAAEIARQGGLRSYVQTLPGSVVKVDMVAVPAGSVQIDGRAVGVKPFWIASTEMTWEAFDAFTASGPPAPGGDHTKYGVDAIARPSKSYILPDLGWGHHGYPAINISFLSAQMFCRWLSASTGKRYRLPTEAEWQYACQAGSAPAKLTPAQLDQVAWYARDSGGHTHPVAKLKPNAWQLYDMLGNVGEWATDLDGKPVLCGGTYSDKAAAQTPYARARQTPAWQEEDPQLPKSQWWLSNGSFVGFRVVCEP